jgi:transcriptional regulator of NAD metabolism
MMGNERQGRIVALLRSTARPITGNDLAAQTGVSRQVIVQDVALLRAAGEEIIATPLGYILAERRGPPALRSVLACRHDRGQTEDELMTMIDLGLKVIDVIVEHPIYGELRGMLSLASRDEVRHFIAKLGESEAGLLSELTHGVHLHTVDASRADQLTSARAALGAKGYLLEDSPDRPVMSLDKTAGQH